MMVRIVVITALLASLFFLVKYMQPVSAPVGQGKVATSGTAKPPVEAAGEEPSTFNPTVPAPLPDVNNGYVFSEKRKYEKDEPVDAAKLAQVEQGPDPLESLLYSGSIVAGNLRRALVVYQEPSRAAANRRPGRGAAPAADSGEAAQNKQLNLGEHFLGYVVAAIEPDRIIFEKGDRKVEKFLYDRNKKRLAPPEPRQQEAEPGETGGVPLQAIAPPEVLAAMMAPQPSARRSTPGGRLSRPAPRGNNPVGAPVATEGPSQGTEASPRMIRRSQRILGLDSSGLSVPVTPVPGLPVPTN